jgi:hypothetical protein
VFNGLIHFLGNVGHSIGNFFAPHPQQPQQRPQPQQQPQQGVNLGQFLQQHLGAPAQHASQALAHDLAKLPNIRVKPAEDLYNFGKYLTQGSGNYQPSQPITLGGISHHVPILAQAEQFANQQATNRPRNLLQGEAQLIKSAGKTGIHYAPYVAPEVGALKAGEGANLATRAGAKFVNNALPAIPLSVASSFVNGKRSAGDITKEALQAALFNGGAAAAGELAPAAGKAIKAGAGQAKIAYKGSPVLSSEAGKVRLPGAAGSSLEGKAASQATQTAKLALKGSDVVNTAPLHIDLGANDKQTAQNLRDAYVGYKNAQTVSGNQFADAIKKAAPNEGKAIFWYNEAGGDIKTLKQWATDGEPLIKPHVEDIKAAINLSPEGKVAADAMRHYYDAAGTNALDKDVIHSIRQDYNNSRLYLPDNQGDYVKTGATKDLMTTTSHAKQRVYNTMHEAILNDKVPATTDAVDLMRIHNEELARTVASKQLVQQMSDGGIGKLVTDAKEIPAGWKPVNVKGIGFSQKFVAPEHIASGLRALTDPNFLDNYQAIKNVRKFQGVVKTVDLSYSMFHHLTMLTQMLGQTANHPVNTAELIKNVMGGADIRPLEKDFVGHGGITAKLGDNMDLLHSLATGAPSRLDKLAKAPIIKQLAAGTNKSSEFLFGTVQRYLKTMDYSQKAANWVADHPQASNAEVTAAKRGLAKEVNNAYGGLNWESMGVDKTTQSAMRLAFLAPDWLVSNFSLGKQALGIGQLGKGAGGSAARRNIATTLVGGMLATETINKLLTGHYTNDNEKGHKFEIQVQPGVYVSLMRGGIGDLIKLGSMIAEDGPTTGAGRYFQGKLSPVGRTAVGFITGKNYYGQDITKKTDSYATKLVKEGKFIASSALPVPFGVASTSAYLGSGQPVNPVTTGMVATGLARYSAVPKSSPNAVKTVATSTDAKATSKTAQNVRSVYGDVNLTKPLEESANRVMTVKAKFKPGLSQEAQDTLIHYARLTTAGRAKFNADPENKQKLAIAQVENGTRKSLPKVKVAKGKRASGGRRGRKIAVAKPPKVKFPSIHLNLPKNAARVKLTGGKARYAKVSSPTKTRKKLTLIG